MRVALDFRVREGGCLRYGNDLTAGLREIPGMEVNVLGPWPPFTPWGRRRVAGEAARLGADVLHGLQLELPRTRIPSLVTIHDLTPLLWPASMPNRARRLEYRRLVRTSLGRAQRVLVPGEATAGALVDLGADRSKLVVVPLGVSPAFRPASPVERERARHRFADGGPYVAVSTGWRPHKNLAGALTAAALVRDRAGVPSVAAGEGPDGPIRFVGHLSDDDLRLLYAGAETLVVASFLEGFGLPALEALACRTPVVCGPGLGALPYLRGGVLEVDVAEPDAIAGAAECLLADAPLRERLAAAGRGVAAARTTRATVEATATVYEDVLRESSAIRRNALRTGP